MKYLKIVIALVFLNHQAFSQTDSTRKKKTTEYEFGMNVYDVDIRAGDFYTRYTTTIGGSVFNGLYYKAYYGKNVMRYSFNYFRGREKNHVFPNKRTSEYSFATWQLSAGYQRMFSIGKFTPYVFGDFSIAYHKDYWRQYYYEVYPAYYSYILPYYPTTVARKGFMYSMSTGAGLRMKLGKHMVFNLESAAQFYFLRESSSGQIGFAKAKRNIVGINGKPLTVGLGILF